MKKILLVAAALMLGVGAASAQKATKWFIGGSAKVAAEKYDKTYNYGKFSIAPQVGYMFNDNWGIALDVNFGLNRANKVNHTTYGAGLSGLYVMKITDKFAYTPGLRLGFGMGQDKAEKVPATNKFTEFGVQGQFLKFEFRPSCHWGITAAFGGLYVNSLKSKDADKCTLTGGLDVKNTEVGFKYYF